MRLSRVRSPSHPDVTEKKTNVDTEAIIEDHLHANEPDSHEHPATIVQSTRWKKIPQLKHAIKQGGSQVREIQNTRRASSPLETLGAGRVDPFSSHPDSPVVKSVAGDSAIPELMDYSESNNFAAEMCLLGTTEA